MANLSNINNKFLVTTTGEVLVGRTAATGTSKLQVSGSLLIGTDISSSIPLVVQETTADGFAVGFMRNTNANNGNGLVIDVNSTAGAYIQDWRQASTVKMRLLQNGNLGIGTDSPSQKLVVQADWNGSLSNNQQLQIQGNTDTTLQLRLGYDTTNDYAEIAAIKSGTGYKNLILNRGGANVGIGTSSPAVNLHVEAAGPPTIAQSSSISITSGTRGDLAWYNSSISTVANIRADVDTSATADNVGTDLAFFTRAIGGSLTQKMVIKGGGNVGIGVPNPGARLELDNPSAFTNMIEYGNVAWNQSTGHGLVAINRGSDGYVQLQITSGVDNADVFTIRNSGTGANIQHNFLSNGNAYHAGNVGIGVAADTSVRTFIKGSDSGTNNFQILTRNSSDANILAVRNDGNVGIGTTSPDFALDIEAVSGGVQLQMGRTTTSAGSTWMGSDSNGFHLGVGAYGAGNSAADPNGFTVLTSGNVGIGTASPDSPLHLSQAAANTFFKMEAYASTQGADAGINVARELTSGSSSNLSFWTNTGSALTQKLTIDSSGNVTIGTAAASDFVLALRGGVGGFFGWDDSTNKTILQAPNTRKLSLRVNSDTFGAGTEAILIDSNGSIGMGANSASYRLRVKSDATVDNGIYLSAGTGSGNHSLYIENQDSSAEFFAVRGDGEIRLNATSGHTFANTGIRFGTNAAANNLNYYGEGTWTPVIAHNDGTGVVPITVNAARYLRVGQLVYVSAYLTGINPNGNAGGSGAYYGIRGFPFQPENYGAWQIVYASSGITAYGGYSGAASLYFMANGTNGQRSQAHVNGAGVNAWGSNLTMMFNCVYNING